jgi:hypothetical protein
VAKGTGSKSSSSSHSSHSSSSGTHHSTWSSHGGVHHHAPAHHAPNATQGTHPSRHDTASLAKSPSSLHPCPPSDRVADARVDGAEDASAGAEEVIFILGVAVGPSTALATGEAFAGALHLEGVGRSPPHSLPTHGTTGDEEGHGSCRKQAH